MFTCVDDNPYEKGILVFGTDIEGLRKMVILHQNKFAKPVLEAIYSKN